MQQSKRRFLLSMIKTGKKHLYAVLFARSVNIIFSLSTAIVLKESINALQSMDLEGLIGISFFAIVTTIVLLLSGYWYSISYTKALNLVQKDIQSSLLRQLLSMQKSQKMEREQGRIVTQITQTSTECVEFSMKWLVELFAGVLSMIVILIYMNSLNLEMTIILVIYNALIRLIMKYSIARVRTAKSCLIESTNKANNLLIDILKNPIILRIYKKHAFIRNRYIDNEKRIYQAGYKLFSMENGAREFIWCMQKVAELAILYGVGGYLIITGRMDIGAIAAFTILSNLLMKSITSLADSRVSYYQAEAGSDAISDLLHDVRTEQGEGIQFAISKGGIRFEDVRVRFGDRIVLNNVSFEIEPGDKVCIVGKNGQGKSTLLNLISGIIRPDSGMIYLDKYATNVIHIDGIADNITYIPQNAHVIDDDIYRNVALSETIDRSEVNDILIDLAIDEIKEHDPLTFSQGEQQRVCIGRGAYKAKKTPIVLCDEILTNVDHANRERIASFLMERFQGKTVLMVVHDEHYFKFNKKLIVENGRIELIKLN